MGGRHWERYNVMMSVFPHWSWVGLSDAHQSKDRELETHFVMIEVGYGYGSFRW